MKAVSEISYTLVLQFLWIFGPLMEESENGLFLFRDVQWFSLAWRNVSLYSDFVKQRS